jgi:hypothetical protein
MYFWALLYKNLPPPPIINDRSPSKMVSINVGSIHREILEILGRIKRTFVRKNKHARNVDYELKLLLHISKTKSVTFVTRLVCEQFTTNSARFM